MSKNCDNSTPDPERPGIDLPALGIEPLDARSVVVSALLGVDPEAIPVRGLVALGELFDMRPGTVRTSLSRMAANGELVNDGGRYRLTGRLLDRRRDQFVERRGTSQPWDGRWWTVVTGSDRRDVAERRAFRAAMGAARFAELRPDIWMRPANLAVARWPSGVIVTHGDVAVDDVDAFVARLWPVEEIELRAQHISGALDAIEPALDGDGEFDGDTDIAAAFVVAAAAVRFLRAEPRLPDELAPAGWTAPAVRSRYHDVAPRLADRLRRFYAAA